MDRTEDTDLQVATVATVPPVPGVPGPVPTVAPAVKVTTRIRAPKRKARTASRSQVKAHAKIKAKVKPRKAKLKLKPRKIRVQSKPDPRSKRSTNRRRLIIHLKTLRLGKRHDTEVAEEEGVTRETVRRWRQILKVSKFGGARRTAVGPTEEQQELVRKAQVLSRQEEHFIDVCRKLKVSTGKLIAAEKATGTRLPRRTAKLTREDVLKAVRSSTSARQAAGKLHLKHITHVYRYLTRYSLRDEAKKRWGLE